MKETGRGARFNITFILTIKISFIFISEIFLFWKLHNSRTSDNSELMWLRRFFSERLEYLKGFKYMVSVTALLLFLLLISFNQLISILS